MLTKHGIKFMIEDDKIDSLQHLTSNEAAMERAENVLRFNVMKSRVAQLLAGVDCDVAEINQLEKELDCPLTSKYMLYPSNVLKEAEGVSQLTSQCLISPSNVLEEAKIAGLSFEQVEQIWEKLNTCAIEVRKYRATLVGHITFMKENK